MSALLANRTARWALGTVALCLVLLVAAWFLLISPRRDDAATLRQQATSTDEQAQLLTIKLTQLKSKAADLPQQKAKLKQIAAELTPDADIPKYLNDLQDTSVAAGVKLLSVTPATPTLVTLTGTGTAAAAVTGSAAGLGQPGDLVSLPMNLTLSGDYYQLSEWLKQVQTKVSRSYLVTGFTLTPGDTSSSTSDGLSGASIDDSGASFSAAATSSPSSTSKGEEGATPTATSTATGTAVPSTSSPSGTSSTDGSVTSTATSTGAATATTTDWTLVLTGTVFVLLTDDSTLEDVKADAAAAQASLNGIWTEVTPSATATATPNAPGAGTTTTATTSVPTTAAGAS